VDKTCKTPVTGLAEALKQLTDHDNE